MANLVPGLIERLIEELTLLPSVGRKSAQRMAYFLLRTDEEKVESLANAIVRARKEIRRCSECLAYSEENLCSICSDGKRQGDILCVVEKPEDVEILERFRFFQGRYHVLGGCISPLDGIGPEDLNMAALFKRLHKPHAEIILALGTQPEGEATAGYVTRQCAKYGVRVTRLAIGIPQGSDLQYVDEVTMRRALENRVVA